MKRGIYEGRDPRDIPTYGVREAARFLCLPESTLKAWVRGPAQAARLSFWNLAEAYVLAGIRDQGVSLHLKRVERDIRGLINRIYPWTREVGEPRVIEINSRRAFGRPVIAGTAVPVEPLLERFRAGDSLKEIALDYRLDPETLEGIVRWESAAGAWRDWYAHNASTWNAVVDVESELGRGGALSRRLAPGG